MMDLNWMTVVFSSGISLVLYALLKYGFSFLSDLVFSRVYSKSLTKFLEDHKFEVYDVIKEILVNRLNKTDLR